MNGKSFTVGPKVWIAGFLSGFNGAVR